MKKYLVLFLIFVFSVLFSPLSFASEYYSQGKTAFYAQDYENAESLFEKELDVNPDNYECRYFLAHTYFYQKKQKKAKLEYEKVANSAASLNLRRQAIITLHHMSIEETADDEEDENDYYKTLYNKKEKPVTWRVVPITVFIDRSEYKPMIKAAFREWEKESKGVVRFTFIGRAPTADIAVYVANRIGQDSNHRNAMGLTTWNYDVGTRNFLKAKIDLLSTYKNGERVSDDTIYAVTLHEIGHAVGILGHSPSNEDLMYPYTNSRLAFRSISKRDINTLKKIYGAK